MALVRRLIKNSPLTFAEGDANLVYLEGLAINTGSFATKAGDNSFSGSQIITGSLNVIGSTLLTGSLTVSGSITTTGTLTVRTLVVEFISSSITYSSGSNKFGDQTSDTQTFTGSVGITGSLSSIGALSITNDISASNSTQLSFGPGTAAGSNLFLQSSGSSGTNALEIRPYGVNFSQDSQSYIFRQPLGAAWGQSMVFDKNNSSITILNGNSDGGATLSRPTGNGFESRLTSGISAGGITGILTFYTSGSERVRIDGSGSLLVGTTTNNGYATIINGSNTTNFPRGALYVTGSSSFTGSLNITNNISIASGSINITTGSISIAGANILNTALAYSIIFG
jgi:hypothetical protein